MEYTGIGSRETPHQICQIMTQIARKFDAFGLTLRSGGADGADNAFEICSTKKKIYLPWEDFNDKTGFVLSKSDHEKASMIAKRYVSHYDMLSYGAKKLHNRNVCQILDIKFDEPTDFVVCWTKDAKLIGGTATALKLAMEFSIPIFNLANYKDIDIMLSISTVSDIETVCNARIERDYNAS